MTEHVGKDRSLRPGRNRWGYRRATRARRNASKKTAKTVGKSIIEIRCEGASTISLDQLIPLQGNLKSLSTARFEKLKTSLVTEGFCFPFHVWKHNRKFFYIDGHQRDRVLKELAKDSRFTLPKKYPVVFVHAKDRKHAARLILIASSQYGEMDNETLYEFLHENELELADMTPIIELPQIDLEKFEAGYGEEKSGLTDDDAVPEPPAKAITNPGDLWILGDHRLLCGDSQNEVDMARLLSGADVACVFTDPPYGVGIGKKNVMLNTFQPSGRCLDDLQSDDMDPEQLYSVLLAAFKNLRAHLGDKCAVFVCSPQGGGLGMMMMMMRDAGLEVRHILNWVKNAPTFSMGRLDYDYQHEPILFTWTKTHKRLKQGPFQTSIWEVNKPMASKLHPTMKPVELPANAFLNHTEKGDAVADIFCGSGTTLIAAEKLGRRCFGMEIEPGYCDVIVKRWEEFTGRKAVLEKVREAVA